jgi:ligand-binding sensor domain-containing protein
MIIVNRSMEKRILMLFILSVLVISTRAQWVEKNDGLYGGQINSLLPTGVNLYAATNGGVFLSTNNGASWTTRSTGLPPNAYVKTLVANGTSLFAGTSGNGVFRSINNGTSWLAVNTGLPANKWVYSLAVSGSKLFASLQSEGVFVSADNGTSWLATNTGLPEKPNVLSLKASGSSLFAGTSDGIFLSADGGLTWTAISVPGLPLFTSIETFEVSGPNLFAGTRAGVYLSNNNGTSWVAVNNGLTIDNGLTTEGIQSLVASGVNLFAGSYNGIFVSSNNGANWTRVSAGTPVDRLIKCLAVKDSNLFAGTDGGGIFLSTNNGLSWTAANTNLTASSIYSLAKSGSNLFAGTDGAGVFLSTDNGTSWSPAGNGLPIRDNEKLIWSLASSGINVFAGTGDGVYLSTNNGMNWTAVNTGLPIFNRGVAPLVASGSNLFAGLWFGGVFLSTNNGASWTAVNNGLSTTGIASLEAIGNNLYATTFGGGGTDGGVFLSTNNGSSWASISNGLPPNSSILSLAGSGTNLFAGTNFSGVYITSNNGTNWTAGNSGLPANALVKSVLVSGSNLFAGTAEGVFLSTNNGTSWAEVNTGLNSRTILSLVVNGSDLIAGTSGGGIWSRSLSDFSRKDQSISFGALEDKIFGEAAFVLSATSNSSLPLSYTSSNTSVATISGSTVSIVGAGSTTITASQAGNSEYNPAASVQQVLSVNKASLTATAENKTKTYGDDNPLFTISYLGFKETDNSSVIDIAPSISSIATTTSNTGAYPITLTGGTDNNYMITNVSGTLTILPKDQTITFLTLSDRKTGDAAFVLTATASSSLPVSFESLTPNKITVSGNLVTITAPGKATIRAKQGGTTNFNAAPNVDRNFCVLPAKPVITLSGANSDSPVLTSNASTGNQWFFNGNSISGASNPTLMITQPGVYTVRVTIEGCVSELSDGLAVVITGDIASSNEQITAYPNPSQDRLYILLNGFIKNDEVHVKLVDPNGKVLYQKDSRGGELLETSLAGFAAGVYLINADQGRVNQQVKIVKK